jgi:hypothetical protein
LIVPPKKMEVCELNIVSVNINYSGSYEAKLSPIWGFKLTLTKEKFLGDSGSITSTVCMCRYGNMNICIHLYVYRCMCIQLHI